LLYINCFPSLIDFVDNLIFPSGLRLNDFISITRTHVNKYLDCCHKHSFSERSDKIRIISVRRARKEEIDIYES
jgi:hypothetical protein